MSEETAIKVENVSKNFKLPHEKHSSLKSKIVHSFSKTKGFQTQHALKDVSFEVKKGEFFGIVGRNGSGKSTLLKMLAGIYQPSEGKISVNGRLVPFIELGVGFNPELTGRENVFLNGALLGFTNNEVAKMYDEIVGFAELERFMDQKLKNYSSGMQVRLAFSMAVRAKADVLLIDEVLAVGDADFQRKCFDYFQKIKKDGITVVFVTHDMNAIRQYCDRAALVNKSEIIKIGLPEAVASEYTKLFLRKRSGGQQTKDNDEGKDRWGDEIAVYESVKSEFSKDNNQIKLTLKIRCMGKVDDPVYGFVIKNQAGQPILGTNTLIEKIAPTPIQKGEKLSIEWSLPNIFNEGEYTVEPAIVYNSTTEVADWWVGASTFEVIKDIKTPYLVNPDTGFRLIKK